MKRWCWFVNQRRLEFERITSQPDSQKEDENYMIFSGRNCNYPQPKYAKFWLSQFRRWGMVKGAPDYKGVTKRVLRSDIYLEAMKELGVNKQIAEQTKATLFDSTLDAADPEKYATSFPVHSLAS